MRKIILQQTDFPNSFFKAKLSSPSLTRTADLRTIRLIMTDAIRIEAAREKDMAALLAMVRREAEFEKVSAHFTATEEKLREGICGKNKVAEALIAWAGEEAIGFSVFYTTFSTFSGQCGIYMEDLFVEEKCRGSGVGRKLLSAVAKVAMERGCHSVNWSVFKWNEKAIGFYRGCGAEELKEWDYYSLSGEKLKAMAEKKK